ncbi:IS200/IS605 family transposase [candidate division KSB1 bacterium]|nr:IS200/IS605 family transposase [candidate division KSB1 bacterium]
MISNLPLRKGYLPKQYRKKFETDSDVSITHTSYALYYLLSWSVKQRFPLIEEEIRDQVEKLINKKCLELGVHDLAVGINPEHVHSVLSLKPNHYIPEVVKELKGYSSHEINKKGEYFIDWTRGYDIRTISQKNLKAAIQYVKNQRKHHRDE